MTQTSWPYVDQSTTDIEYEQLAAEFQDSGVIGSLGDTALQVYADSSGMQIKVRLGGALVRGYRYSNTAEVIVPVDVSASNPRIDRCVLELDVSQSNVDDRILLKMIDGTPAASGATPPALTQDPSGVWQISLGQVAVGASTSTIASGNITDERSWIGSRTGQWANNAGRPSSPRKYKIGFNQSIPGWEYWDGASWVALVSSVTAAQISDATTLGRTLVKAASITAAQQAVGIYVQDTSPGVKPANSLWFKKV
jgi:hypothetical protein